MIRKFILVAGLALVERGSTVQLMLAQLVTFFYVATVLKTEPYRKAEADFTNQAANIQIMLALIVAMALKTDMPAPGSLESAMFDVLLSFSNFAVIGIGSYSFFKCIKRRAATLAHIEFHIGDKKTGKANTKTTLPRNAKVHPAV